MAMTTATRAVATERAQLRGTVKRIKHAEGFMFIHHAPTDTDYFAHKSDLAVDGPNWEEVRTHDHILFTPTDAPRGPRAIELSVIVQTVKCDRCDGTGYVCAGCERPDGDCTCQSQSGPDPIECDECNGKGKVPER